MNKLKLAKKLRNKLDKEWKKTIHARFNNICVVDGCGKTKYLNAHHILPKETYKKYRHDPMNGVLLCPTHHKFGKLSAHKNALWFVQWLYIHQPNIIYHLLPLIQDTEN